jgi:hypothetical protein
MTQVPAGEAGPPMSQWDAKCGICEQQGRWWTSRSGDRVCMVCAPDPFAALQTLARRVPGGVPLVQSWLEGAGLAFDDIGEMHRR